MIFGTPPGRARRIVGRGLVALGSVLIVGVFVYFALNPLRLGDLIVVILGAFVLAIGATLTSFGLLVGGTALTTRRVGCIALLVFSVPTALILAFLVVSLFSTAPPRPSSSSAAPDVEPQPAGSKCATLSRSDSYFKIAAALQARVLTEDEVAEFREDTRNFIAFLSGDLE